MEGDPDQSLDSISLLLLLVVSLCFERSFVLSTSVKVWEIASFVRFLPFFYVRGGWSEGWGVAGNGATWETGLLGRVKTFFWP